jgi:hypothetical protein
MLSRALLTASLLLAAPTACTSPPPPPGNSTEDAGAALGSPCVSTSDCIVSALCGYPIDAGCSAQGICVPEDLSCPTDGPTVCGCDGTPIGLACIYGVGYAPAPIPGVMPGCQPSFDSGIFDQ